MEAQPQRKTRKPRVLQVRRIRGKAYIEECRALQRKICEERGGELVPDSTEIIRAMREGDPSAG